MPKKVVLEIHWCWQCPFSRKDAGHHLSPDTWTCNKLEQDIINDEMGRPVILPSCDLEDWPGGTLNPYVNQRIHAELSNVLVHSMHSKCNDTIIETVRKIRHLVDTNTLVPEKKFLCKDWYPEEVIVVIGRECTLDCFNCDLFQTLVKKRWA